MEAVCRILPPSGFALNSGRRPSLFTVSDPLKTISLPVPARRPRSFCLHFSGPKISGDFPSSGGIASPGSPKVGGGRCPPYKPEYSYVPFAHWDANDIHLAATIPLQSWVAGAALFNGVMGCALTLGKMNCRKKKLDFFFSTLFISSFFDHIVPSAAFASDHHRYMFNLGHYTPLATLFTFGLKAAMVAALGFAAGLAISSGLVWLQNRMDPYLATALNWGLRMGLSSNFRYQVLKRAEFLMARVLTPAGFKDLVAVALRWLNNVLGKMLTPKDTDLLESESHSKRDAKDYENNWGEGASPLGNLGRSQLLMYLKFLVPGGKFICEISVSRFFGSGRVVCEISVSPFFESV